MGNEITHEQLEEYCKKRDLVIVTHDYFQAMQALRQPNGPKMEQICKNCANSEKVCGSTMIVICSLTGFPKCYDNDAEHCIGFEPKEENNESSENTDTE